MGINAEYMGTESHTMKGLLLLCFFAAAMATVTKITSANADSILKSPHYVKFFAPWCGHCKNMAADWETLSNTIKGVTVAEVDCPLPDSKPLCEKYGVRGYPTLKFFKDGTVYQYNRPRKVQDWVDFVEKQFYLQENVEKASV